MINEISIIPVNMENFENKYIRQITNLFNSFREKMQNPELKKVLERCFVTSLPKMDADTLICGINPSYNNKCPENFKFRDLKNTPYFSTLHDIIRDCKSKDNIEYIDLFCFRHTDQRIIWEFVKDPVGLDFIVEHLKITQKIIEEMHPKTILVFNRTAANFFGKNANPDANEPERRNLWMGYKFSGINADKYSELKDLPNVEVKKIVGLHDGRIYNEKEDKQKESKVLDAKVYFGSYMRYVKREKKDVIRKLIARLIDR